MNVCVHVCVCVPSQREGGGGDEDRGKGGLIRRENGQRRERERGPPHGFILCYLTLGKDMPL